MFCSVLDVSEAMHNIHHAAQLLDRNSIDVWVFRFLRFSRSKKVCCLGLLVCRRCLAEDDP